ILLDARSAQARQTVAVDRSLPRQELVDGQLIALACLFEAEQAATDRRDNLCLPPNDPALGFLGRKIGNGQRAAIGADDIAHTRSILLFGHDTRYTLSDLQRH